MDDCIFCKIIDREIPATIVYEDDGALAFEDLNPQAPIHVLVISKTHVTDIGALGSDPQAAAAMTAGIAATVADLELTSYRTVFNTGPEAGQTVFHVHAHVLAGREFGWPPG